MGGRLFTSPAADHKEPLTNMLENRDKFTGTASKSS